MSVNPEALAQPNQDPIRFSEADFKTVVDLGNAVAQNPDPSSIAGQVNSVVEFFKGEAAAESINTEIGIAAALGAGIGAVNNSPARQPYAGQFTEVFFRKLSETAMPTEHQQVYRSMVQGIQSNPGHVGVLADTMGSGMRYASGQEQKGQDMTSFKALIANTVFTGTMDPNLRGTYNSQLHAQITR